MHQLKNAKVEIKPFLPSFPAANLQKIKKYKFTYVGSLSINKQLHLFIESVSNLDKEIKTNLEICIVLDNSNEQAKNYENQLNYLNHINVHFKFKLDREQIFSIYEETENFVATSKYESFFLPAYEANHFGCHLILPEAAGYSQEFQGYKNVDFYKELKLIKYI